MKNYELIVLIALIVRQLIVNYGKEGERELGSTSPPHMYEISRVTE